MPLTSLIDTGAPIRTDHERLRALLRTMMLIRRFDEIGLDLIRTKRIPGVVHPYIGQESCAVGVCSALRPGDRVISNHRGHGHCISAGTPIDGMMAELFGRETGSCRGRGGSMHIADFEVGMLGSNGIVGAGLPIVGGAALSDLLDGNGAVTVCFFGEGATGQGVLFESINIAALWHLPVLYVCENNGYASETPFERTLPVGDVAHVALGHGVAAETIDGRDVLGVHDAAEKAVARLRAGDGPFLLECMLDRWEAHSVHHTMSRDSRDAAYKEGLRANDPIGSLRNRLIAEGVLSEADIEALRKDIDAQLDAAISFAESSPFPEPDSALEGVFA